MKRICVVALNKEAGARPQVGSFFGFFSFFSLDPPG
jgi:hypothetical protein